jgi:hypothetical protein
MTDRHRDSRDGLAPWEPVVTCTRRWHVKISDELRFSGDDSRWMAFRNQYSYKLLDTKRLETEPRSAFGRDLLTVTVQTTYRISL